MDEEEVKQLIKNNLKISINQNWDWGDLAIVVKLLWKNEEIESDICFVHFSFRCDD
jgi:hypothetical protein